ncbi:MAG: hypothetical protein ACLPJJ_09315 [Acidocella sp.]|uniref:hypothetical protein n=1 Tax=Acidocella sp. TaxID=50710 RepID=UPI003FD6FCDF
MLRGFVIGLSLLALAGGLLGMLAGAGPGMVGPMIFGLLLLVGTVFEPHYHRNEVQAPGSGWEHTGEIFKDPAKGAIVEVWYNETSGERCYVARGQ